MAPEVAMELKKADGKPESIPPDVDATEIGEHRIDAMRKRSAHSATVPRRPLDVLRPF
jgi:hypothetical protein